jgi:cysteine desulfurase
MPRSYFDHNATTPVSPEALEAMLPAFTECYGNASSIHFYGQIARQRLESARRQVAKLLGAKPAEIVFVSGGTEADNLAITGTARAGQHVITTTIEHPAVLSTCEHLEAEVTYVPVGSTGVVDPHDVRRALRPNTILISVMHANNELGTIQPIAEIAAIAREANVLFHSDGVQAAGKLPVQVPDLYAISGHKIGAPKGIGALYVRDRVRLSPILHGGRHERGLRAGTENVAGAVALGAACEWAAKNHNESARIAALRDRLERGIEASVPGTKINCANSPRTPNTSNILFDAVQGEAMVIALDLKGFAVSSGSACSSGSVEPSHVLTAIGMSKDDARSCLRFSLGRQNNEAQVDALIEAVSAAAAHLRRLSPVTV